jgi:hypothetical protein
MDFLINPIPSPGQASNHRAKHPSQGIQGNVIENNFFNVKDLRQGSYGIWLGSRQGRRSYCEDDAGYPFGSSIDNRDFADHNAVRGNIFQPASDRGIRDDGADSRVMEK